MKSQRYNRLVRFVALFGMLFSFSLALNAEPARAAVSGYRLPWTAGRVAYMTSGTVGHRHLALDFDIEGAGVAGQVRAAKSGQIVFRKDSSQYSCTTEACWQSANMVVISHSTNEYSWYLHLAPNSIPASVQVGTTVVRGAVIGTEGRTGYSSNVHLHFHVTSTYGGETGSGDTRAPRWQTSFQEVNFDEYSWADMQQNAWRTSQNSGEQNCAAPNLSNPSAGQTLSDRRITFSWQSPGCGQGYTLRIKDSSSMDSGGTVIYDQGVGETSRAVEIPEQWVNRTLYWGVRAANVSNAQWSVRSFQVRPAQAEPSCNPNTDQVALFEHANYGGRCVVLGAGEYRDAGSMGFANDSVSSIRVGSNVRAIVYEHANYGGRNETFTGDDTILTDNAVGNDSISSARVERRTSADVCPAPALAAPGDGATVSDPNVNFSWGAPSGCTFQGYTFRIKDTPSMDAGGTVIVDTGVGETTIQRAIPAEWHNRDLYWGVRTANPLSPNWAVRRLRITPPSSGEADPQAINAGQSLDGRIDPASEDDTYTFTGAQGQVAVITMQRSDGSNLDSYIELLGPAGLVSYNDDSNGSQNSRLEVTLPQSGNYRILAHSYAHSSSGAYRISLTLGAAPTGDGDDNRWLSFGQSLQGNISPGTDRDTYYFNAVAGRTINLRMTKRTADLDSYLELFDPSGTKVAENDDSGGDRNAWLVATLATSGTYRIVARSYNGASSGGYTISVDALAGNNLARGKTAYASSIESNNSSFEPSRATDGNTASRWSSTHSEGQWIYIDLGDERSINQVVLRWERAFADHYDIYVYGRNYGSWHRVYSTTNGDGNVDTITFSPVTARYVMMFGRHRYAHGGWQQFGYSLWEFEVYNTLTALVPTVPPDNSDKPSETLVPLIPLPPDPQGKNPSILSQGTAQESTPPSSEGSQQGPAIVLGEVYGLPTASIALSMDRATVGQDVLLLRSVDAYDSDEAGDGIVAYRWESDIDGFLGASRELELPAARLSIGLHTVSLSVQDDEGNWSEPVSALLEILPADPDVAPGQYTIYLPLLLR